MNSIHSQTMRPSSVYIIHDGCENEEPRIYKDVINIFNDRHNSVSYCRNQGARASLAENLLFVDADDCLDEHFIESMVKVKSETKADIIYPNVLLWSSWHKEVKLKNAWHESPEAITFGNMMEYNQIVVTSLIDKKLYFEVNGMPNLPILEDYSFYMRCLDLGAKFAKSPFSVLRYRQRAEGRNRKNNELKNEWYYKIREEYLEK